MSPEASPERPIGALENLFGDLSDLVRKEIRLARAELADKAAPWRVSRSGRRAR
jgi:hypothetical protein